MAKSKVPATIPGKPVAKTGTTPPPSKSREVANVNNTTTAIVPFAKKGTALIKPTGGGSCNYLQFMNVRATKFKDTLKALGLRATDVEDDFPVVQSINGPVLCDPLRFVLSSQFFQHFSVFNEKYEIQESVLGCDERPGDDYTECIEALIIVLPNDGTPLPVMATLKGTKTNVFHDVNNAIDAAKTDANDNGLWLDITGEAVLTPFTSRRTKRDLVAGTATTSKTTAADAKAIEKAFSDKGFLAQLDACVKGMQARYAEVERKNIN